VFIQHILPTNPKLRAHQNYWDVVIERKAVMLDTNMDGVTNFPNASYYADEQCPQVSLQTLATPGIEHLFEVFFLETQ
jgi:hypothetical protein